MTGEDIELIEHYKFRRGSLLAERRNRGYTLIHAQTGALSPGCAHPGAAIHSNSSTGLWESKPGRRSARSEKRWSPSKTPSSSSPQIQFFGPSFDTAVRKEWLLLLCCDSVVGQIMIPYGHDSEVIMTALIIRRDRTPVVLRKLAKAEATTRVARRLLAIANALSGMSRKEAAEAAGMDRQTLRDWVIRYNAHGLDGLYDCWGDGRPPRLEPEEQAELTRIVLAGPDADSGVSAFTREDLARICEARFGKTFHPASVGRLLKRLDFSRQKARPSHPQKDPAQEEAFKKSPSAAASTPYTS